jgi:hypothetical protein
MEVKIAPIVEGHGECEAVPILIRRIALTIDSGFVPRVLNPLRVPVLRLIKSDELERSITLAANKLNGKGGIVVIVDCDWKDACPKVDAPRLLERAKLTRSDIPISVVLAKMEFEAWFIAAAESLAGQCGLSTDLASPANPEEIRGAKEWLSSKMHHPHGYIEIHHQPSLTNVFDMNMARQKSPSFDKCFRDISRILQQLRTPT